MLFRSLPSYAKNIVFSKYDIANQQITRESCHSTKSNSEEPLFNSQKAVSRSESTSVSKDPERESSDNSEEQESKGIGRSKSEKFGTDIGHSSFVDESKGVLEDGQSTIPYLSPTKYSSAPAGATALCRDGTYSFSRSRRGTCSHHGGVKKWL